MRVSVVIPALDEEACIGWVVAAVPRHLVDEIIVVDNGSTDATAEAAVAAGARVVREKTRGYGSACRAGARAAGGADVVVFLDGDWGDDPRQMGRVLAPILEGEADLVISSRLDGHLEPGAIPPHQLAGNRLATALIRLLYGLRLRDLGSFRAVRREVLEELRMSHPTYGWPVEMVVKAARKGYRIQQVPVDYRRRIGRSKVGGTLKGSVLSGYHIISTILVAARGD